MTPAGDPSATREEDVGADPPLQPIVKKITAANTKRQARLMGSLFRRVMVAAMLLTLPY
jgi:hypothetical protein